MRSTLLPRSAPLALLLAGALVLTGCFGSDSDAVDPTGNDGGDTGNGGDGGSGTDGSGNNGGNGGASGNGGAGGDDTNSTANQTVDPTFISFPFSGSLTASAGAAGNYVNGGAFTGDAILHSFAVEEGVNAIVLEMRWDNTQMDLELFVDSAACNDTEDEDECFTARSTDGSYLAGDSPITLRIEDPTALADDGEWGLRVFAKNAVTTSFEGVVTVFYGGMPVPADYTGFAA